MGDPILLSSTVWQNCIKHTAYKDTCIFKCTSIRLLSVFNVQKLWQCQRLFMQSFGKNLRIPFRSIFYWKISLFNFFVNFYDLRKKKLIQNNYYKYYEWIKIIFDNLKIFSNQKALILQFKTSFLIMKYPLWIIQHTSKNRKVI